MAVPVVRVGVGGLFFVRDLPLVVPVDRVGVGGFVRVFGMAKREEDEVKDEDDAAREGVLGLVCCGRPVMCLLLFLRCEAKVLVCCCCGPDPDSTGCRCWWYAAMYFGSACASFATSDTVSEALSVFCSSTFVATSGGLLLSLF